MLGRHVHKGIFTPYFISKFSFVKTVEAYAFQPSKEGHRAIDTTKARARDWRRLATRTVQLTAYRR